MSKIKNIKIDNTDIFLEDIGENQGKITISNTYGYNYSCYWGAMGGYLADFISKINGDYFASKLMGSKSNYKIDIDATFKNLRKFIREEMSLPWYKELEFQKDMRKKLNEFQNSCENAHYFVDHFYFFVSELNYGLIKDKYDSKYIERDFKNISEPWNFIIETENDEFLFLYKLHKKLKNKLSN